MNLRNINIFSKVKFIFPLLCVGLSVMLTGCSEDEMDKINQSTSNPSVSFVDARFQLSDAIMSMAFMTYGGSYSWHAASYTEQILGDGGAQMMYAEMRDPLITAAPTTFNNEWNNTYRNLLSINIIIDKCQNGVNKGQTDVMGIGRVLKVMGFQALTMLHGDIPFSEALRDDIKNPKVEKQHIIYSELLKEIDLAIDNLTEAVDNKMSNAGRQDILYSGDTKKWLALAYAIKARLLLDGAFKFPENYGLSRASAEKALEIGFEGAELAIFNGVEADNSWAAYFRSRHYSAASETVVGYMEERSDPRLPIYASDLFDTGVLYGNPGDGAMAESVDNVGGPLWLRNESASIHLLSKASLYFILAECKYRAGMDGSSELTKGIMASMEDYQNSSGVNIEDAAVNGYISALSDLDLNEVMIQKYISQSRDEQIEAYNDLRRCKAAGENFVKLTNPNNSNNGQNRWPYSFPYGNSDVVSNPNIAEIFGTGNNAGYYIFERTLWLFSN